jgi:hypothetical protein
MTTQQLLVLNSLRSPANGWPCELKVYLLGRCSTTEADYQILLGAGYIEVIGGRIVMTASGKRKLAAEKATHRHWL